ncbi:MAG: TPM domain-containing protein [Phycisphaerales bacterium]
MVERAVADAETRTSAELVVVVTTRSGRYDRAEDLFGLVLALAAVTAAWAVWQDLAPDTRDWTGGQTLTFGLVPLLGLFVAWAFVGATLATRFPILARPFIPRSQFDAEVRRGGFEAFHLFRVGRTAGRTGILIYISLLERTALVVGDDTINATLAPSTWDAACRTIVRGIRAGKPEQGLAEAVVLCGRALAESFPVRPGDTDVLPNTVHLVD